MSFSVAIVGRPNVGKSTLFNRLVGKRLALVDDQPGVTRDLREGDARLGDLRFTVIDTAGLETADDASLPGRMRKLTERAVDLADICLFVIDARAGVTPQDEVFAEILRKSGARVILGANKAEGRAGEGGFYEAYGLGLGEPVAFSAEHGEGMEDLYSVLRPISDAFEEEREIAALAEAEASIDGEEEDLDDPTRPIQIAIVGRPNAGKSTLVNQIIGDERLLTGPEAGITRDAIGVSTEWGGRKFRIFDTAGLRKRAKITEKLEKMSASDAVRAVKFAEVVVVLLDVTSSFESQDLRIADLAEREGRAVVIAVNKWDAEADKQERLKELRQKFEKLLPQLAGAPLITLSALTGRGVDRLREAVLEIREIWSTRIGTPALNRWLRAQIEAHPPPAPSGRRIKIRYMTQAKTRPPTFVIFCSKADELPESYSRYLVNGLRRDFGMRGTPIRIIWRRGENPYSKD